MQQCPYDGYQRRLLCSYHISFAVCLLSLALQEDLTPETTKKILDAFAKGEKPKPGPQSGRHTSENSAGLTALTSKVTIKVFFSGQMQFTNFYLVALWAW
jgi:hypothetical protein